jgi:hypothetical protein
MHSPFNQEPFIFEDNSAVDYTKWASGKPGNFYTVMGHIYIKISFNKTLKANK